MVARLSGEYGSRIKCCITINDVDVKMLESEFNLLEDVIEKELELIQQIQQILVE